MPDSLVPFNSSPGFAQQGSVDWVALSSTSVQYSVAVLSRLSKAGIDAFTLQVGRAICYNFALEPQAQERITAEILKLKRYGSYGNIIWFGFGIREVVTDLANTEEGLTLVGLCASLSTTYDSLFAAKLIRELCMLCKAPETFRPALRQWKVLVELCAGILSGSQFINLVNGFRQLISPYTSPVRRGVEPGRAPTTYTALAEAILTLGHLSKGKYVNATFHGGIDCAWLAAFAEWVLSLKVELRGPDELYLYRSRSLAPLEAAQISIILHTTDSRADDRLLKSRTTVLPSGQGILWKDPALCAMPLLNWQTSWSTILRDTVHEGIEMLLAPPVMEHFSAYLQCFSLLGKPDRSETYFEAVRQLNTSWENHPVNPLMWAYPDGLSDKFLWIVRRRLPELSACEGTFSRKLMTTARAIIYRGDEALNRIQAFCGCALHRNEYATESEDTTCLQVLANTIVIYIWILIDCDIAEELNPSTTGLANLYAWGSHAYKSKVPVNGSFYQTVMNCDYPVLGIDLVFHVLTGISVTGSPFKVERLPIVHSIARSGNGICVYHYALEDPSLPPDQIFRLKAIRGSISYLGSQYKDLHGFKSSNDPNDFTIEDFTGHSPDFQVRTVVQETEDESRLEVAFRIQFPCSIANRCSGWLHLPYLFRKLQGKLKNISCPGSCGPFPRRIHRAQQYGTQYRTLTIPEECITRAQNILSISHHLQGTHILLNEPADFMVLNNYLNLYMLINQKTFAIVPFMSCLKCVIGDEPQDHLDQKTVLRVIVKSMDPNLSHEEELATLIAPNGARAVMKWTLCSTN